MDTEERIKTSAKETRRDGYKPALNVEHVATLRLITQVHPHCH